MTSPDTRPPATDPETVARWMAHAVNDERAFRERVVGQLADISARLGVMEEKMDEHVSDDKERFGNITQSIGDTSGKLQYMLGGAAMLALVVTLAIAIAKVLLP